jgi:hypothetical protein
VPTSKEYIQKQEYEQEMPKHPNIQPYCQSSNKQQDSVTDG